MGKAKKEAEAPVENVVEASKGHKHPKVSKLTLNEIDQALADVQKHMGGLTSKHAQFLLEQRNHLMHAGHAAPSMKKAA